MQLTHRCPALPRFWSLFDPTYAKKYIPIIASVSEHQPTTWAAYIFDLHLLVFAAPAGMYFCFKKLTDPGIFVLTFALTATYFSGIMVRLMLVAAPAFVLLAAMAVSTTLKTYSRDVWAGLAAITEAPADVASPSPAKKKEKTKRGACVQQSNHYSFIYESYCSDSNTLFCVLEIMLFPHVKSQCST